MQKCNHDCFNCTYDDCIADKVSESFKELKIQAEADKQILREQELHNPNIDYRRKWDLKNPERAKEIKHRSYIKHKEEYLSQKKAYYETHKDEIYEKQLKYIEENREYVNARNREGKRKRWNSNPEYYRQKQREYRARKKAEKSLQIGGA